MIEQLFLLSFLLVRPHPEVPELIEQLGSTSFRQREAAEAQLYKIGIAAYSLVREAKKHPDPEIRKRASSLLLRLAGKAEAARLLRRRTWLRYLAKERCKHEDWVASLGVLPQLDDWWFDPVHLHYETPEGFSNFLYSSYVAPAFGQTSHFPDPCSQYRLATYNFLLDARAAGVPKWILRLFVAELWHRELHWSRDFMHQELPFEIPRVKGLLIPWHWILHRSTKPKNSDGMKMMPLGNAAALSQSRATA